MSVCNSWKTSLYVKSLLIWTHFFQTIFSIHPDTDLRDHPNTGTGVWGGLSDGDPVQGETLCPTFISGLRGHRDQNQPSCISVVEQHAEISSEYHPIPLQKNMLNVCICECVQVLTLLYLLKGQRESRNTPLWNHNSEKVHRPRDRLFPRHWIPNGPPTKEDLLCVW